MFGTLLQLKKKKDEKKQQGRNQLNDVVCMLVCEIADQQILKTRLIHKFSVEL